MKLQHLAIIFVIIILPISLVVGEYIQMQIDTIALQKSYSSKLQTATYDSIKAFRLNTVNNKYSTVSDSKVRDIEAAISSYFTSLGNEIKIDAYATEELQEYTPALLYTLYDGYYIYSKYYNETDSEYQYGLKPYVYYTCRYKKGNIDIVVNYTLDNYITIYGNIGENYITKSGNIINPDMVKDISWQNGKLYSLKYGTDGNEVTIEKEVLTEQVLYLDTNNGAHRDTYSYIIYNNNKVYYDGLNYFTINSNFKKQYINDQSEILELKEYTSNGQLYSDSALNYYYEAYLFSKWAKQYLGEITQDHAVDENGNQITDFVSDTGTDPIFAYTGDLDITDSCFDLNRISVIRRSIQTNLMTAIANYNRLSQKGYEYVLPVFSEDDWYKLTSDISVTSFLQGIPIGGKYFNDYCVISNNVNKEVVTMNSLYAITEDNEVHLINCKSILDGNIKVKKVYKNIDFERQSVVITEGNERYYYPHYETKCYNCLVNVAETYDIDFLSGIVKQYDKQTEEYVKKIGINSYILYSLRKEVLQAYGRESYDLYKINEYFKGYDETISTDSITQEKTDNLEASVVWNENTHKATVIAKKKAGVQETLKIQYLVNPTNLQISDNSAWQTVEGNEAHVPNLFLEDKVYFRLYDGTYDGDYIIKTVKDIVAPEESKIEVVEGTMGNNGYYTSSVIKVKITAGRDKESGVNRLTYSLSGDSTVSEQTISDGQIIEIVNNGITTIIAKTYDNAGNSSTKILQLKKDPLAPYEPTIEILGDLGNNNYYNSNIVVRFKYGEDATQPNASGIKTLHYEIENVGVDYGTAYDGQEIEINMQGGIIVRAYMEDNAGNKSAVVTKAINRDATPPAVTAVLASSNITTKSFRLSIGVKDEVSGIDKIVWYYKKSTESSYKTVTTSCSGEKTQITKYIDLNNLASGVYNTYAIVYDKAGNKTKTGILNVTTKNVDTAGGATASPTGWTNGNVIVILPTKSGYTTQYQVANSVNVNGTWTTYSGQLTITKNTKVFYRYTDGTNAGTYGTLTIANIDKLVPGATTVSYAGGSNSCSWKNNYNINLSASDANATTDNGRSGIRYYEIDWDGDGKEDTTTGSNFVPWNGYNSHNTRFRAVDYAGNKGSWSAAHHIHMDTGKPGKTTVNLNGYTSGNWTNGDVTQTATATDDVSGIAYYQYSHDRITVYTFTNPWTINWDGNWNFYVRAVDYAGNVGEWSDVYTIRRDTVAPAKPTIEVTSGTLISGTSKYSSNITVKITAGSDTGGSGVSKVTYILSGATTKGETTITSGGTITITEDGTTTIKAYTYDKAGNKSAVATLSVEKQSHVHTDECLHVCDTNNPECYKTCGGQLFTPYGSHYVHECRVCGNSSANYTLANEDATPGADCDEHGKCDAKIHICDKEGTYICGYP